MKIIADYAALLAVKALFFPLAVLPHRAGRRLARAYVSVLFFLVRRLDGVAARNLEIAFPEKSKDEHEEIRRKAKDVLAENIHGFALIPSLTKEKAEELCRYDEINASLANIRSKASTGLLFATLHFDAFEFYIQMHALNHKPLSILGRDFGLPRLDAWWRERREFHGNTIFSRKGGYKEIIRRLKAGEDVVLLCDQNVKSNHATFVNFFGTPAATTKTLALAALRTGAPVLFGSSVTAAPGRIEVKLHELTHPSEIPGETEDKIRGLMEELHRRFEEHIRLRPEAWYWIHRRWKTRPPGEPETMYD